MINFKKFSKNVGKHEINLVDTKLNLYIKAKYPMQSFIHEDNLYMTIGCNSRPHLHRKDVNNKEYYLYPWGN